VVFLWTAQYVFWYNRTYNTCLISIMATTIAAHHLKLHDLRTQFNLQRSAAVDFFQEWQVAGVALSDQEKDMLDRVRHNYLYLLEYPVIESIVKMVVLSPLLDLAGFYEPPFRVQGEANIQVSGEDEGVVIRGCIDVLAVQDTLWILVIEAKNSEFSLTKAMPQALAYMLSNPHSQPTFGLVLNGSECLFLKLIPGEVPEYATSNMFSMLNQGNDLYRVVQILRELKSHLPGII
jgi:hypothetical protein